MIRFRGATGEVRWSYLTAITFGPWQLEHDNRAGTTTLTATVVSVVEFRAAQTPLTVVLCLPRGQQERWPVESLQREGDTLRLELGPREGSRHGQAQVRAAEN